MPAGKEAMTAESFDVDKEGYSEVTARMLAKKKKESFEAKKIEIDLGSLAKDDDEDEEIEHLSPEERKKRQEERDKRQKERAAHRIIRQKQHDEVEATIPEGE
jgi:molecular chaperone DnaK (HSP70)